ncbi:hypothetical protein CFPU101_48550 [Chroococcus sp. FPU101]|nr:hypothetical protein CFPU101_48550 [Chroococcus sp. FPU101]
MSNFKVLQDKGLKDVEQSIFRIDLSDYSTNKLKSLWSKYWRSQMSDRTQGNCPMVRPRRKNR